MGSMIHLYVGNLAVHSGKNRGFTDHSPFFQMMDVSDVPYYYAVDGSEYVDVNGQTQWKINIEFKEGLSKPLSLVKDRIELLGHTIEHCREECESAWGPSADRPDKRLIYFASVRSLFSAVSQ